LLFRAKTNTREEKKGKRRIIHKSTESEKRRVGYSPQLLIYLSGDAREGRAKLRTYCRWRGRDRHDGKEKKKKRRKANPIGTP